MNNTLKKFGILVLVLGGGYLVYSYFSVKSPSVDIAMPIPVDDATTSINEQFVESLGGISAVSLDGKIFKNKNFQSLMDFSTKLDPELNPGRINPFLPIGTDVIPASTTASVATNVATISTPVDVSVPATLPAKKKK